MNNGRLTVSILLLVAVLLSLGGCSSAGWNDDPWLGRDKVLHFAVSGAIGAGATIAAQKNGMSDSDAPIAGISAAVCIGSGKEYYDSEYRGSFWSWKDLFADIAGGVAGSYYAVDK